MLKWSLTATSEDQTEGEVCSMLLHEEEERDRTEN
jgi:hypothetical protein